ncbi:MAG: ABC transporter ATP-binding protein [bacterium]|nr:ABC transporter ATP-binding protein [bacterium]
MDANSTHPLAPVALRAEGVHVMYHPERRRAFRAESKKATAVHAVKGVNLEIREGEVVGIIGANGSGKSSLLMALAGLLPIEEGRVMAVAYPALLGVRPAIRRHLTGMDNVIIGCMALGLSREEAYEVAPRVLRFAGVDTHADLPLRTWSSGMKARLVFAISTSVQPKILLVDEVLAVGDAEFRKRSIRRLRAMSESAGTVIMVSHKMQQIRKVCTRVIWLHDGEIRAEGKPKGIINMYKQYAKVLADEMDA